MKNSSATHNSYTFQEEPCSLIILVYIFLDLNLFLIIKYLKETEYGIYWTSKSPSPRIDRY